MRRLVLVLTVAAAAGLPAPARAATAPVTVTAQCSDTTLGAYVTVSGRVFDAGGTQLGKQPLTLVRDDQFSEPVVGETLQSDDTWGTAFLDKPPHRGQVTYTVRFAGNSRYEPAEASCTSDVTGEQNNLTLLDGRAGVEDEGLLLEGSLTSRDGTGLSGRAIEVSDDGVPVMTVETDVSGHFRATVPPPHAVKVHQFDLRYAGDAVLEDAAASTVRLVRYRTLLSIDGPERLPQDGTATFVFTLTRANDGSPLPGISITDFELSPWGTTDADGRIRVTLPVRARNPFRIEVSARFRTYDPEERFFAGTSASRLWKGVPQYHFEPDRPRYVAGQAGHFFVSQDYTPMTWYYAAPLHVTFTPYGLAPQVVAPPDTEDNPYDFTRSLTRNSVIRVTGEANPYFEAGTASYRVDVAPWLVQDVVGEYGRDHGTWLVRRTVDPTFPVTVRPNRAGTCAYARVQRFADGAWRPVVRTDCRTLDSTSSARWQLVGSFAAGALYRVRWETPGDAMNVAGTGTWQVLRFTS